MSEIVVVGGGLAGLVTARRLADASHDVTLFEAAPTLGGRVRSREVEGFTCDRGFQVLFESYPAVKRELDRDALDLRSFAPGGVICREGKRSTLSDPLRDPSALVASALTREVSLGDKLRTLALRLRLTRGDWPTFGISDRSIRDYLQQKGFSEAFIQRFSAPLYGGITLDRSLSTSANVFEYTFRAMSLGSIVVPATGMGAISAQLAERARAAGVDVQTGTEVESVSRNYEGATVSTHAETVSVDAVVVAAGPQTSRDLTDVEAIPTAARSVVTQYYRLPGPELSAGTRIMLNAEERGPNTVAQLSAVAPEYSDGSGDALLAASFIGDEPQDRPEQELFDSAASTLAEWYPERSLTNLDLLATDRIPVAQFAQPPGVHASLPSARTPEGAVYLAGDYTRWSSIQGALESGRRAADAAATDLG